MKKVVYVFLMLVALCCARYGFAYQGTLDGEVMVTPPRFSEPPEIVVVPSERYPNQYVYMVPQMDGVYVHQGVWYRYYRGIWFRAASYDAQWYPISIAMIPPLIISVPPSYVLYLPHDYYRIRYWDYHEHWRHWDSGHHWHNHHWFRHEMRPDIRQERLRHIPHHADQSMRGGQFDKRHDMRDRNHGDAFQKSKQMERQTPEQHMSPRNHLDNRQSDGGYKTMTPNDARPPARQMPASSMQQPPTDFTRHEQMKSESRHTPPPVVNQELRRGKDPDQFPRGEQRQPPQQREMRDMRGQVQQAQPPQREMRGQVQQMPQKQQPQQQVPQVKQQNPPPATQQQQQIIPTPQRMR